MKMKGREQNNPSTTAEKYLGYKQRIRNAVNDRI
jgi:hypothetical protein